MCHFEFFQEFTFSCFFFVSLEFPTIFGTFPGKSVVKIAGAKRWARQAGAITILVISQFCRLPYPLLFSPPPRPQPQSVKRSAAEERQKAAGDLAAAFSIIAQISPHKRAGRSLKNADQLRSAEGPLSPLSTDFYPRLFLFGLMADRHFLSLSGLSALLSIARLSPLLSVLLRLLVRLVGLAAIKLANPGQDKFSTYWGLLTYFYARLSFALSRLSSASFLTCPVGDSFYAGSLAWKTRIYLGVGGRSAELLLQQLLPLVSRFGYLKALFIPE